MEFDDEKLARATLALLHLSKEGDGGRARNAFDADVLGRLQEDGLLAEPANGELLELTDEGVERSRALFRELFGVPEREVEPSQPMEGEEAPAAAEREPEAPATSGGPVDVAAWRAHEWQPDVDRELESVEVTPGQLQALAAGLSDYPRTVYLDVESGTVDSFLDPEREHKYLADDDGERIEREAREMHERLEADDRYVVVPEQGTDREWRDMHDFCELVADDRVREQLETALDGKGAFRRFKDTIARDERIEDAWYEYRNFRRRNRVRDFLAERGYHVVVEKP